MSRVPFLDLARDQRALRSELDEVLQAIIDDTKFILGPGVERFETDFAAAVGREHCVGVNSGTSALHLALLAAGVGPGDEVITTPHTWISTSWAVSYCGARPVFADINPRTGDLDPGAAEAAIGPQTKALLPVDLYGNPADLGAFEQLAERHGVALVEDAAQAHGATLDGRPAGSFGFAGCFSFYPGKNLGALGEGGAIVTDDAEAAGRMRQLRDHAQDGRHHHVEIGFNYRMEGIQGAALAVKLAYLEEWTDARRRLAERYQQTLEGTDHLVLPHPTEGASPSWHLFAVRVPDRELLAKRLDEAGIDTGAHYPTPVHLQPAYANLGYRQGAFPEAERFAAECLSLPMFPGLTEDEQDRVVEAVRSAMEKG